jgi:hypothetical protein
MLSSGSGADFELVTSPSSHTRVRDLSPLGSDVVRVERRVVRRSAHEEEEEEEEEE